MTVRVIERDGMYVPQEKFLWWWVDSRAAAGGNDGQAFSYLVEYNKIEDAMNHLKSKFAKTKKKPMVMWECEL